MITILARPLSDTEKKELKSQLPTVYKRVEEFTLKFIFIFLILLAPLLTVDYFWSIPSVIGVSALIGTLPLTLFIVYRMTQNGKAVFQIKRASTVSIQD